MLKYKRRHALLERLPGGKKVIFMKRALVVAICIPLWVSWVLGTTKTDQEVFSKWINDQRVFHDCSLRLNVCQNEWHVLRARFDAYCKKFAGYTPFLNDLSAGCFLQNDAFLSRCGRKKINQFYRCLDKNIALVQRNFQNSLFLNAYAVYADGALDATVARYRKLFKLFLNHSDKYIQRERCFALANRMFEYCFGPDTNGNFCSLLMDRSLHPIAELFYATMWYSLASKGWQHWHDSCLRAIKKEYNRGKEIVYVAGGSDIYQLLKNNIFRIRVIDPLLPSQPLYYSEGWDWLVTDDPSAIGDRLILNFGNKKLVMMRTRYEKTGMFAADLSTAERVDLPKSITTWTISEKNKKIGYVIFERRFCDKNDFSAKPKQTLLMSFNEMYYIVVPADKSGWGIGVDQLPDNITLYVKQLRRPLNKKIMTGIVRAEETPLNFISLGSCVT